MSTLVAQTISNGTVSTSSANVIRGSAKAWVNYNSVAQTIRASYNVSSVTYNGVGDYTINFTNALPDANYCVSGLWGKTTGRDWLGYLTSNTLTTSTLRIYLTTSTGSGVNLDIVGISVFD